MKRSMFAIGIASFCILAQAADEPRTWNFNKDKAGEMARGFTNEVGNWIVVSDRSAPSKGNVLAQTAKNSGSTFNLTLVNNTNFKDVNVTVKMKAVAGSEDQGGGLVWRAKDKQNYYVARYNPLEDNYRVYKVQNGQRSEFQSANVKGDKNWHSLRVTMKGATIQCFLDGKKYLNVNDNTFSGAGRIGLWTKADAQSNFDDLAVTKSK